MVPSWWLTSGPITVANDRHRQPTIDSDAGPVTLINVAQWDNGDTLCAATAQQYFQQSRHRSMQEVGVTGHPALYRVALEVTAPELSEQQTLND